MLIRISDKTALTRSRPFLIFERREVIAGHKIHPEQMVMDLDHAGDVLRGNDKSLAIAFIGDHTAQMRDTIADDDVQPDRTPVVLFNLLGDELPDVVVISMANPGAIASALRGAVPEFARPPGARTLS